MGKSSYKALVIGGSAGSLNVILRLFSSFPRSFKLLIIFICHLDPRDDSGLVEFLRRQTKLNIKEAEEKEKIKPGCIYVAPANYHLLVEEDESFSLSVDPKVNYSRPSIDVLFESAAMVWGNQLIGLILTGASKDGAEGIRTIEKYGGLTIAQDPADSEHAIMPQAAINTGSVNKILSLDAIENFFHSRISPQGEEFGE